MDNTTYVLLATLSAKRRRKVCLLEQYEGTIRVLLEYARKNKYEREKSSQT